MEWEQITHLYEDLDGMEVTAFTCTLREIRDGFAWFDKAMTVEGSDDQQTVRMDFTGEICVRQADSRPMSLKLEGPARPGGASWPGTFPT
jgi:hypothetical protein